MRKEKDILLGYYGDDFTGSSDVLEVLSLLGIPTILFLEAPSKEQVENFAFKNQDLGAFGQIAFGVAGIARSLAPAEMEKEIDPIFEKMAKIPFRYFHYKICSTLDSSPKVGNIGTAMKVAEKHFPSDFIPLVVGFPTLNRFVAFGNLYARIGKTTYRLDRHPVMARHPITPMTESDIRLHLKKQMDRDMELVELQELENLPLRKPEELLRIPEKGEAAPLLLFDTVENNQLNPIGQWLHRHCRQRNQLLLGSSAMEYALGRVYGTDNKVKSPPKAVTPILVVAGSCAQNTADQILHAEKIGFQLVRINVKKLYQEQDQKGEIERVVNETLSSLQNGNHTVVFSALGPEDPHVKATLNSEWSKKEPQTIAKAQAVITKTIVEEFPLKRLVTAGGDTSGYILKALDIVAFEFAGELAPGAPLCIAHGKNKWVDGMEIAIKGGQNGNHRYFEYAQQGGIVS
ncbi:putative type III effector Hop protein [Lunatimonas lonarensis]|uniref:Putative type III effector Hop protein n=1 Tax=Lunatimonas lonarensis TaxID=1232681 RepID=R7ZRA0_9BACT|nr:four-carbon acid sugar kinase family protein [Lunatimonas lonarensis]EON76671.1 putative type III effector Hop protein [Lunatimonas lonarensis]